MKRVGTLLALTFTALFGNAAFADGSRPYTASSAYWSWVDSMNFPAAKAEPAKSAARPYTANDAYWAWMDSREFPAAEGTQAAGRPYTASDGYWAWVDQMPGESQFVGTKAKAPAASQ